MTDVMTSASGDAIQQGATYSLYGALNAGVTLFDDEYEYSPHISGREGVTTNNYLDDKLDDVSYYG